MFKASSDFFAEITRMNDFSRVCAASVWTMRWQVKGFFAEAGYYESPSSRPKEADLRARFLAGTKFPSANFRSLVDGQTWLEQEAILAEMVLLTIVSLYEGWCDAIAVEAGLSKAYGEGLQWPSQSAYTRLNSRGNALPGMGDVLQGVLAKPSPIMTTCFYPKYRASRHFSLPSLDHLMFCYRYWKEIRNSLAHAGGRATDRAISEESRLAAVSPSSIGMSQVPRAQPLVLNEPISFDLYSVNGLGEALYNIVTTVDAELSKGEAAEALMLKRWETVRRSSHNDPPLSQRRREDSIRSIMSQAGMIAPTDLSALNQYLTSRYGIDLRVGR